MSIAKSTVFPRVCFKPVAVRLSPTLIAFDWCGKRSTTLWNEAYRPVPGTGSMSQTAEQLTCHAEVKLESVNYVPSQQYVFSRKHAFQTNDARLCHHITSADTVK